MISVNEALRKIESNIHVLDSEKMEVENALDYILAADIYSPINMPPFAQSAMDGYAIGSDDMEFELISEIQAGDNAENIELKEGQAARIFTGAMVPKGTFSVAKQEIVERSDNHIRLTEVPKSMANIRPLGEQIMKGNLALSKGSAVTPGIAGFLYTLGINSVHVIRKPKVIIIATGNELVAPGEVLTPGKIYESNTYMIQAALKKLGLSAEIKTVKDDFDSTKEMIRISIEESDLLITTGGISVGDYDYVGKAMQELNVETVFYKVKQKPGKPIFFGKKNNTSILGLPGNPAAALSCFYLYVTPAIRKMSGFKNLFLEKRTLQLTSSYKKNKSLSHFLKANCFGNEVTILNAQSSAMLSAYTDTNCLIHMVEEQDVWEKGDLVDAYILP